MKESEKPALIHTNPLPICAGLELSVPQGGEGKDHFWLNAEIVFGQQPLSGEGVSFRLGVKTGFLTLTLEDCWVAPGTRYAMRDQPASIEREVREEATQTDTRKGEGAAGAKLAAGIQSMDGDVELGAKIGGSRMSEYSRYSKREGVQEIRKVTARGTNSEPFWEICDPDQACLDGRYLGDENICQIKPAGETYRITASFVCRKRDLLTTNIECGSRAWFSRNKEGLALAVVAKRLSSQVDGEVELCRSVAVSGDYTDQPEVG